MPRANERSSIETNRADVLIASSPSTPARKGRITVRPRRPSKPRLVNSAASVRSGIASSRLAGAALTSMIQRSSCTFCQVEPTGARRVDTAG